METQEQLVEKPAPEIKELPQSVKPESAETQHHSIAFGISIRGWIAMIVIGTVCFMSIRETTIKEPLYTLAGLVVGFYFGQNPNKPK